MDNQNNSGVNTVLIVVILVILVGALVWFFTKSAPVQDAGFQVDVNLPAVNTEESAE
jgi:uncharacterized membrane protein YqiK